MISLSSLRLTGFLLASATFVVGYLGSDERKPQAMKKTRIDFNRDVRPILATHCFTCHGPDKDALQRTGGMRLDTFEGATADRGGYSAIAPGRPADSMLLKRVSAPEEMRMPPADSGVKALTKEQIEILRQWIQEGGEYRGHWAYIPPKMPSLPKVSNAKWIKNEIDRFVLADLDEAKLKPEAEADKATLLRRATLTLTGLPPTPTELNAFIKDKRADAYERAVDRLMASPRYGENQARYWLDAVRYADTHGLHIDNERAVFPYRDWVVRAYNQDLPFDKFTIWQLAGDLLPNPTTDQMIATGYIRLNPTTNEGGVIEAEFLAKNTFDRIDTTATVFLGATMQCAKCHDHKYDPYSQREYYSMYAFFNSTADAPLDGNLKLHEPVMPAPSPEQERQLKALTKSMKSILNATSTDGARQWASERGKHLPQVGEWQVSPVYPAKDFEAVFNEQFAPEKGESVEWKPIQIELEKVVQPIGRRENAAVYLRTSVHMTAQRQIELRLGSDDGIMVWLNGNLVHSNKILRGTTANADKLTITLREGKNDLLLKIANSGGGDGVFVGFGGRLDKRIADARDLASKAKLTKSEEQALRETYLELGPNSQAVLEYRKLSTQARVVRSFIPMTYIAKELPKPRPTHVLKRGEYSLPGDLVSREIPAIFGKLPKGAPTNRLGLAKWIVDPNNPLTARVIVNRIWQQHFGRGLVASSEDFGSRGEWPSNPALLDYLAVKFVKEGWSVKKLTKLILTSAAYRQASIASAAKRAKDPDNVLISRGPRFRLDAEVVRDSALYVSGLLRERPGGRGDKPYQPEGLWEIIAYPISDTARYMQDHGPALYRRSLYMFWKRTSPPPTMLLFDAPMREACVVRRSRTNTPTQALATLNETGFFEAARVMAQEVMKSKKTDSDRIDYAFRIGTGRAPSRSEAKIVGDVLKAQRLRYTGSPEDATKTLSIGEWPRDKSLPAADHAAWTLVCNMILNLDETLTQH